MQAHVSVSPTGMPRGGNGGDGGVGIPPSPSARRENITVGDEEVGIGGKVVVQVLRLVLAAMAESLSTARCISRLGLVQLLADVQSLRGAVGRYGDLLAKDFDRLVEGVRSSGAMANVPLGASELGAVQGAADNMILSIASVASFFKQVTHVTTDRRN